MFRVRKMEPKDFSFAVELANTMNWNMTSGDFEFNMELEPNGCFILQEDLEPVGLATCISYGSVGWFGNLIVKEDYRKKGAGTALVNHAVNYLKRTGATTVGIYAYQHLTDFYRKLGFKRDVDFAVLKTSAVASLSGTDKNLKTIKAQDISRVVDFDGACFGASRKKLLELVLQNPRNLGYVAVEGSDIVGYAVAKVYDETAEIGPLVCQRNQPETALKLLKTVLCRLRGLEGYMYVPSDKAALLDVAFKANFREEFRLARMFLGSVVPQDCVYIAESLERG